MKSVRWLAAAVVLAASPVVGGGVSEHDRLQGRWELASVTINGSKSDYGPGLWGYVFRGDNMILWQQGKPDAESRYTLDLTVRPTAITFGKTPSNGEFRGLIKVEGDTLWLAVIPKNDVEGKKLPAGLEDAAATLYTLRRVGK